MTRLRMLLVVVPMTVVLAGCSSGAGSDSEAGGSSDGAADAGSGEAAGFAEAPTESLQDGKSVAERSTPARSAALESALEQRAVVSTGTVSLRADDVAATRREVQRIIDGRRGLVTEEDTETDEDGAVAYTRLVVRVPSSAFDETMEELETSGELRSSQRASEDVTTQVIDTEVRVRAQRKSLARVEQLLGEAETLKDVIWIESQLTQRQAELDSLESRQAWLADQTSLSTVTVDIERATVEKKERDEAGGFLGGLDSGWSALTATAAVLATVVGALLPFAVVGAILGAPVWLLARRSVRRRRTTPAA